MRPKRISRQEFNKIAANLGEEPEDREQSLLSQGYYWMPWKGKSAEAIEEVLHHPIRKPVRRLVGLGEYLQGLTIAVDRMEKRGVNVERLKALLGRKHFSPVHLEGIYAFPGEAIRVGLVAFEDTGSGTPFLKSGDLDNIREIIDMYENVGLLPSTFTTIRPYELKKNNISEDAILQGQAEVKSHLSRLSGINLPPDPLIARLAPQHLKAGILKT
jgi:hypothetical protein